MRESWREMPLGEAVSALIDFRGRTPKKLGMDWGGGDIPALSAVNVRPGGLDLTRTVHFGSDALYRRWMTQGDPEKGDVIVTTEAPLGNVAQIPDNRRYILSQRVILLKPLRELLDPDFLAWQMRSPTFQDLLDDHRSGTTAVGIRQSRLVELPILVPPLHEQRRILAKVGGLHGNSRRAREALDSIPPLLEKLRQSILAAAFRGDLTRDWRAKHPDVEPASELLKRIRVERRKKWEEAELAKMVAKGKPPRDDRWKAKYEEPKPVDATRLPELPEGWCWASADQLLVDIEAGRSPKAEGRPAEPHEQGVLKVSAVSWEHFDPLENKALAPGDTIGDAPTVRAGDLLISRANTVELVGAVVLVEQDFPNLMLSDKTLRLAVAPGVSAELLLHALRTRAVRALFEGATGTSDSMRNITQQTIRSAPVALPPASETEPLLRAIRAAMAARRVLARTLEAVTDSLSQLERATLARAFRDQCASHVEQGASNPCHQHLRRG